MGAGLRLVNPGEGERPAAARKVRVTPFFGMVFGVAAQDAGVVGQLPPRAAEGVADADIDVFVVGLHFEVLFPRLSLAVSQHAVQRGIVIHFDPGTRHADLNADMILPPVVFVMAMRSFDDHAATGDAVKEMVEVCRFLPDAVLHGRRGVHVTESNLHWVGHSDAGLLLEMRT